MNIMRPYLSKITSGIGKAFNTMKQIVVFVTVILAVVILFNYLKTGEKININEAEEMNLSEISTKIMELEKDTSENGKLSLFVYQNGMCNFYGQGCSEKYGNAENQNNGMINNVANLMSVPYEYPPASAIGWLQESVQDAGFVPATYAYSGVGFSSLSGYMHIWKLFQELSFIILVLIMITIGFLIMFRVKIGSQAEIGIQNALPRIVIVMILIAFSFPIAGFLIDMMYFILGLGVRILFDVSSPGATAAQANDLVSGYFNANMGRLYPNEINFVGLGGSMFNMAPTIVKGSVNAIGFYFIIAYVKQITTVINTVVNAMTGWSFLGSSLGNGPLFIIGALQSALLIFLFPHIPGFIIGLIFLLTLLLFIFKVFFILLSSYLKIILYIIFSPIILLFSALPGVDTIGWWFKNLIGELLAFPTVAIILMAGRAITSINNVAPKIYGHAYDFKFDFWIMHFRTSLAPQNIQPLKLPFLHGLSTTDLNALIGFGLILMIPDFIKMVKGWVGVKESGLNLGIGSFFAGAGIFTSATGAVGQIESLKTGIMGRDPMERQKGIIDFINPLSRKSKRTGAKS